MNSFVKLAISLALLLTTSAFAQTPACIPMVRGEVAKFSPRAEIGAMGRHVYWWCKDALGVTRGYGFSCTFLNGGCNYQLFAAVLADLTTSTAKVTAIDAAWAANIKFECGDVLTETSSQGALCRERADILAKNQSVWLAGLVQPGATVYKVKVNGTATTRPAYALVAGVLGTKEAARAPVGATCNASKPSKASGSDLWAEFDAAKPGIVALCAVVKP